MLLSRLSCELEAPSTASRPGTGASTAAAAEFVRPNGVEPRPPSAMSIAGSLDQRIRQAQAASADRIAAARARDEMRRAAPLAEELETEFRERLAVSRPSTAASWRPPSTASSRCPPSATSQRPPSAAPLEAPAATALPGVPLDVIERFRSEYREMQADRAYAQADEACASASEAPTSRPPSAVPLADLRSEMNSGRGGARTPMTECSKATGVSRRRKAQTGRKSLHEARAAQSTIGSVLSWGNVEDE